jgi:hypothetical protein
MSFIVTVEDWCFDHLQHVQTVSFVTVLLNLYIAPEVQKNPVISSRVQKITECPLHVTLVYYGICTFAMLSILTGHSTNLYLFYLSRYGCHKFLWKEMGMYNYVQQW